MILIIDMTNDKLHSEEFVQPIASIIKESYEIQHHTHLKNLDKYTKVIISGTALKDLEYFKNLKKFEWLRNYNKPLLGICAGMQIIGLIFNSNLKKCQEIGMKEIKTLRKNKLFSSNFKAYELHNYSIDCSDNLYVLAKSSKCVEAVKHKKKEIYGVLFHPEVRNKKIISRFIEN